MTTRIALVTDTLHFIGASSAKALASDDMIVLCHDDGFSDEAVRKEFEANHPGLVALAAQTPEDLRAVIEKEHGRLDVIIHNDAFPARRASAEEMTPGLISETMEHLVHRPLLRTAALVPLMKKQNRGRIIFATSAAPLRGLPNYTVYVTARGAMNAATLSLSQELARWNILVNAIAPNFIESPTYFPPHLMEDETTREKILSRIPLRRLGKQDEAASLVAFLASEDCGFMTGHVIPLAGGWA